MSVRIVETDETGNTIATYVESVSTHNDKARIDIVLPEDPKSLARRFIDVFLPTGYPHSVTEDYLEYQIYDSLQAFSSSIAGLLASRAVLEGVGVGDASASPTAALLLTILQESMGRIATILFAHHLGTALEPECKMFRLLADIFNDIAMILDCLSPAFPKPMRVVVLGGSSMLRALCGVAAGSSKASLSAHFARSNNLAELNAKDSSQETIISLLGMAAGSVVVTWVTSPTATWTALILLLSIHLGMNHAAVRAVTMRTLNRQRATIVFAQFIADGSILTPNQVSLRERIFERDGVMRNSQDRILGRCEIGISPSKLFAKIGLISSTAGDSVHVPKAVLARTFSGLKDDGYVLYAADQTAWIVLSKDSSPRTQLKAWYYALLTLAMTKHDEAGKGKELTLDSAWTLIEKCLKLAGWDLETGALETHPGSRASWVSYE